MYEGGGKEGSEEGRSASSHGSAERQPDPTQVIPPSTARTNSGRMRILDIITTDTNTGPLGAVTDAESSLSPPKDRTSSSEGQLNTDQGSRRQGSRPDQPPAESSPYATSRPPTESPSQILPTSSLQAKPSASTATSTRFSPQTVSDTASTSTAPNPLSTVSQLRTILPAPPNSPPVPQGKASIQVPARRKSMTGRVQVAAACLSCRKKKVKCDGVRPTCARCSEQKLPCEYDSDPDLTRMVTLKRRYRELELEIDDLRELEREVDNLRELEREVDALRELFSLLQTRPEAEALQILHRIRGDDNPDPQTLIELFRNEKPSKKDDSTDQ